MLRMENYLTTVLCHLRVFFDEFQYTVGTKPDGENVSGKDIYKTKMKSKPTGGRRLSWQELRD